MNNPQTEGAAHLHTFHPGEEERVLERVIFGSRPVLLAIFLLVVRELTFTLLFSVGKMHTAKLLWPAKVHLHL